MSPHDLCSCLIALSASSDSPRLLSLQGLVSLLPASAIFVISEELSPDPTLGNPVVCEFHSFSSKENSPWKKISVRKDTLGLDSEIVTFAPEPPSKQGNLGDLFPSRGNKISLSSRAPQGNLPTDHPQRTKEVYLYWKCTPNCPLQCHTKSELSLPRWCGDITNKERHLIQNEQD